MLDAIVLTVVDGVPIVVPDSLFLITPSMAQKIGASGHVCIRAGVEHGAVSRARDRGKRLWTRDARAEGNVERARERATGLSRPGRAPIDSS